MKFNTKMRILNRLGILSIHWKWDEKSKTIKHAGFVKKPHRTKLQNWLTDRILRVLLIYNII